VKERDWGAYDELSETQKILSDNGVNQDDILINLLMKHRDFRGVVESQQPVGGMWGKVSLYS